MHTIVETITGTDTGYKYSNRRKIRRGTTAGAARAYARSLGAKEELTVVAHPGDRRYGEVLVVRPHGRGYSATPVVTDKAQELGEQLLDLLHEIGSLKQDDAVSLKKLLESIVIDQCYVGDLDGEHPASSCFTSSLNETDAIAGVLLFMYSQHDLPHYDRDSEIELYGGFSPARTETETET